MLFIVFVFTADQGSLSVREGRGVQQDTSKTQRLSTQGWSLLHT